LWGSDLEMKARIEYLWPIVHQHPLSYVVISLTFAKDILVKCKKLQVN
jgi:hypothetical protein